MMTQMIGYEGDRDEVFAYAKKLGEAMQYTNFLRDVAEDRNDHQRVYMPLERLQEHGLNHEDIKKFVQNKKADERRVAFCKQEVLFTQQLYLEALPGILSLDRQGRFAVWIASMLYAGILRKIEQI
jgi:phytoene synthase